MIVERVGERSEVTRVLSQSPLRVLTPRNHGDAAWLFLSSLGGGFVGGDALSLDVRVGDGACCWLSSQASSKAYRAPAWSLEIRAEFRLNSIRMYELFIANKNYSSWSLRPWVLMKARDIPFTEKFYRFAAGTDFRSFSPSGRVPCLVNDGERVWDSLAICEYLAERHPGLWPTDARARAWARSASAEMHSGFGALRETCSMSCGLRVKLTHRSDGFERELSRLNELWSEGMTRFGGPFLAGNTFTIVDAFFAPVAFRVQTYGLEMRGHAATVAPTLLALPAMKQWYADALAEDFRDASHEDFSKVGTITGDLRAPAR